MSPAGLGTGFILLGVTGATVLSLIGRLTRVSGDGSDDRLARLVDKASPHFLVLGLLLVGGCLQLAGDDGIYWAAGSSVVALAGGVINAWLFLTRN